MIVQTEIIGTRKKEEEEGVIVEALVDLANYDSLEEASRAVQEKAAHLFPHAKMESLYAKEVSIEVMRALLQHEGYDILPIEAAQRNKQMDRLAETGVSYTESENEGNML